MAAQLHFGTGDSVAFGTSGITTSNTISFNKSDLTNLQVGDLVVAWIHDQSSAANTVTSPGGWTRYGAPYGVPDSQSSRTSAFYYYPIKVTTDISGMQTSPTWSFTSGGRLAGVVARATGIDLDNIEDTAATAFSGGTGGTTLTINSITTTNATTLLVGGLHHQNSASTVSPSTTSFMTAFQEYKTSPTGSTNANTGATMGYSYLTSAGATGSVVASFDSSTTLGGGELVAFKAGPWSPPSTTTYPTVVGTPTTYTTSNAVTSFTISTPAGIQDGDVLILALSAQSQTTTADFGSSGWSRISQAFVSSSSINRTIAFYALPVPSASALTVTSFTFTSSDSSGTGGRIAAEIINVRGAELTNLTTGISPYGTTVSQAITVTPNALAVDKSLLLVGYNANFVSGIDYTIASGPAGMTQQTSMITSTTNISKTALAVYQQNVDAGSPGAKTLSWAGAESQTSGASVAIRAKGVADPNSGVAIKYTSAPDTLSTAHAFYTSATDTLSTPVEVRPFPNGYSSVAAMLATNPFYVAHRGGDTDWPELSLYAFTQAGFWGVGALEVSLARTSDGVWFGLHDATLDRTSGTSGFTASAHTWAEVQAYQITAGATNDHSQPTRPYMRWEEIIAAYYNTHVIFVDPKQAGAYSTELLNMMDACGGSPTTRFVAKSYGVTGGTGNTSGWPHDSALRGYKNWGYFYQTDSANIPTYQGRYDILGMDYTADAATWSNIMSYGKPVIGHIITNASGATTAFGYGAVGLMVGGVKEAIPRTMR